MARDQPSKSAAAASRSPASTSAEPPAGLRRRSRASRRDRPRPGGRLQADGAWNWADEARQREQRRQQRRSRASRSAHSRNSLSSGSGEPSVAENFKAGEAVAARAPGGVHRIHPPYAGGLPPTTAHAKPAAVSGAVPGGGPQSDPDRRPLVAAGRGLSAPWPAPGGSRDAHSQTPGFHREHSDRFCRGPELQRRRRGRVRRSRDGRAAHSDQHVARRDRGDHHRDRFRGHCNQPLPVSMAKPMAAPALLAAPALEGSGRIGEAVALDPEGLKQRPGAGARHRAWRRDGAAIAGAAGPSYCRRRRTTGRRSPRRSSPATPPAAPKPLETAALGIVRAAPRAVGTLADLALCAGREPGQGRRVPGRLPPGEALAYSVTPGPAATVSIAAASGGSRCRPRRSLTAAEVVM